MAHSRFSPSSTEREFACPASFMLNEGQRDDSSGDADHGTAAHHIGELCLSKNRDVEFYAGCVIGVSRKGGCRFVSDAHPPREDERTFEVDDEMVENVQKYVDWCRELPGEHHVEVRVEHTDWCPDKDEYGQPLGPQYGTSDHNACVAAGSPMFPDATLVITDLKYGRGLRVDAEGNKQAIKYALGVWKEFNWVYAFERVLIRICQPRLGHFDTWEISVEELLEWGDKIKRRLNLVFAEDPPFGPSEKGCKFCKAAATCRPLHDFVHSERALMFDAFDGEPAEPDVHALTDEELFASHRMLPLIEIRKTAVEKEVARRLYTGQQVGDLVLVESVARRTWREDPDVIEQEMNTLGVPTHKLYKREFITPAQAEKIIPKTATAEQKEKIAALWVRPPGKPSVATPRDKRKRYEGANLDDFEMYEDGEDP